VYYRGTLSEMERLFFQPYQRAILRRGDLQRVSNRTAADGVREAVT